MRLHKKIKVFHNTVIEVTAMKRKTFDSILTSFGLVLMFVMLISGSLLMWGYSFTETQVHNQLAAQRIYFPDKGSPALASKEIGPYLNQYAGKQLLTGAEAEAYADHFIAVHLQEIGGGKTYSQLSAEAQANPKDVKLASKVNTMFKGETLRGLLLEAYAFWMFGEIALVASISAYVVAVILCVLVIFGWLHLRTASVDSII